MPKREDEEITSPPALKSPQRSSEKRNLNEKLWKAITFVIIPISLVLLRDVILFQIWAQDNSIEGAHLLDLVYAGFICFGMLLLHKNFNKFLFKPVYLIIEDKHQGEERVERTKRVTKWIYDVFYYGSMTFFVFFFYGDAYFIPGSLLGAGNCDSLYVYYPMAPKVPHLKQYYLIQLGSHICAVLEQLFYKRKDIKFYEYFLHHYLALVLVMFSYLTNAWALGSMVLIIHDISDIFLAFARAVEGQKYLKSHKTIVYGILGITAFMWAYCRTYVFPTCAIYASINVWGVMPAWNLVKYVYTFEVSLLFVLLVMNFHWVFVLSKMFTTLLTKDKLQNDYDPRLLKQKDN